MQLIMPGGTLVGMPEELTRRFLVQGAKLAGDPPPRDPRPVPAGRRIRVLAVVHGWFPHLAAGSERMMQHLLDALPQEEFEVEVLSFGYGEPPIEESFYIYEGTPVHRGFTTVYPFDPDVIIYHHGSAARVVPSFYTQYPHAWVVAVYHNDRYDIEDIKAAKPDLNVFNTKWVRESVQEPGIVVHPPLEPDRHRVDGHAGEQVTLINLQKNKGVDLFKELAWDMQDVQFLGVIGTHGEQETDELPADNVEIFPTTQDMREVWAKTKILLVPSGYESYGMVAAEASLNGIPVVAHPTPGLVECLDSSGIFIDRGNTGAYEKALRLLLTDENHYRERSSLAALRGRELEAQTRTELSRFVQRLRRMIRNGSTR